MCDAFPPTVQWGWGCARARVCVIFVIYKSYVHCKRHGLLSREAHISYYYYYYYYYYIIITTTTTTVTILYCVYKLTLNTVCMDCDVTLISVCNGVCVYIYVVVCICECARTRTRVCDFMNENLNDNDDE